MTSAADRSLAFFRDLAQTGSYSWGRPAAPAFTPDGDAVLFLRSGPRDPVLKLNELDLATGQAREILSPESLLAGAEETLSVAEKARRERMRVSARGFSSFQLTPDGTQVLVALSGQLYVLERATGRTRALAAGPGPWIDPRLSPDGAHVAAVAAGELHVIDIAEGTRRRLTSGATETLTHGLAEFVAQEEMDRNAGYWWSPDASRLAYQETDESAVETLYIANIAAPEVPPQGFRYPRAGREDARVRLGIVARSGGTTTWVEWDRDRYPYLARVAWKQSAPLTVLVQSRDQRKAVLLAVDAATGRTRTLLTETDDAWLNLPTDARRYYDRWVLSARALSLPHWLADGSGFLWPTERRGDVQLELRRADGSLARELTPVGFHLAGIDALDEATGTLVVAGGEDSREVHLYRVPLAGGPPVPITREPGIHGVLVSRDQARRVHLASLADGRTEAVVERADGTRIAELPSVAETPPRFPNLELTRVAGLDALVLRPHDFEPGRRYPVLLYVYGGPTLKLVTAHPRRWLREQWLADEGYVVVAIDGRGTPGHGRDWQRALRGDMAGVVIEDQVAGLQALGARYPEMDLDRVGVIGWSYGGYMAAMLTLRRPDVFRAGVAGAPVTDWADYDTHYSERYLGRPQEDPAAYARSSVLTYAAQLQRPLLLIHGLTDDNVYFAHTLKLARALFDAGRPYQLLPLSGTHMIVDPREQVSQWTRVADFFSAALGLPVRYAPAGTITPAGT